MKSAWSQKSTRVMLALVAGLLAANLLLNTGAAAPRPAVAAGLPDSGAQLERLIDEVTKLNKTVDTLQSFLESGKLTVKVEKTDK